MKRALTMMGLLLAPVLGLSWETATQTEIQDWLNSNYDWWGNVRDGSSHGTYVERSVDTVKINADGSASPSKLRFTWNTATGLYRWLGNNPTAQNQESFDVALKAWLDGLVENAVVLPDGTLESYEIESSNAAIETVTVKAQLESEGVISEYRYLVDKDGSGNVRARKIQ